jgi:hypothetical protein
MNGKKKTHFGQKRILRGQELTENDKFLMGKDFRRTQIDRKGF